MQDIQTGVAEELTRIDPSNWRSNIDELSKLNGPNDRDNTVIFGRTSIGKSEMEAVATSLATARLVASAS